jgi:predicted ATPase
MQGYPVQAMECVRRTVADAESMDIRLGLILDWTFSVPLWTGDLEGARKHLDAIIARTEARSLGRVHDLGFRGQLAISCGEFQRGVESLQRCIEDLRQTRYELMPEFNISLVQGLAALGRVADGMALIDEAIGSVQVNGDPSHMPELLRVKGGLLLSIPQASDDEAEMCFQQSLHLSRSQGALSWELRTTMDLARMWAARGRSHQALALLEPVCASFLEGSETADLQAAARLLATLKHD